MHSMRLLLHRLPELLVEQRAFSRPGRGVAVLPLARRFARRGRGRAARSARGSLPALSLPHDPKLLEGLPERIEPREGDRRGQKNDGRASGLTRDQKSLRDSKEGALAAALFDGLAATPTLRLHFHLGRFAFGRLAAASFLPCSSHDQNLLAVSGLFSKRRRFLSPSFACRAALTADEAR